MRIRHSTKAADDRIELQMAPMIDIVFQLLAFFIMTFKVVAVEGDFYVQMPPPGPSQGAAAEAIPTSLRIRLTADAAGEIAGIDLDGLRFASFQDLNKHVADLVADAGELAEAIEVELDADFALQYRYTMAAVSAVSGYRTPEGRTVQLIEKINFAAPRED